MKTCTSAAIVAPLAFVCLATAALADFAQGRAAYLRGDYGTALQQFRPLATAGNPAAQIGVGWIYDNGLGVPHDDEEAAKWYRLAAEQSCALAQQYIGLMYAEGQGVPKDLSEAAKWFRSGAARSDAGSQYNLGVMYRDGKGVRRDLVRAMLWFTLAAAADAGNPHAIQAKGAKSELALKATPRQLSKASKLARAWKATRDLESEKRCAFDAPS